MGLPMLIPLEVSVIRPQADHTVVSVGPYRFHSPAPLAINRSAVPGQGLATDQGLEAVASLQPASRSGAR
jgi:hypothetical protein